MVLLHYSTVLSRLTDENVDLAQRIALLEAAAEPRAATGGLNAKDIADLGVVRPVRPGADAIRRRRRRVLVDEREVSGRRDRLAVEEAVPGHARGQADRVVAGAVVPVHAVEDVGATGSPLVQDRRRDVPSGCTSSATDPSTGVRMLPLSKSCTTVCCCVRPSGEESAIATPGTCSMVATAATAIQRGATSVLSVGRTRGPRRLASLGTSSGIDAKRMR